MILGFRRPFSPMPGPVLLSINSNRWDGQNPCSRKPQNSHSILLSRIDKTENLLGETFCDLPRRDFPQHPLSRPRKLFALRCLRPPRVDYNLSTVSTWLTSYRCSVFLAGRSDIGVFGKGVPGDNFLQKRCPPAVRFQKLSLFWSISSLAAVRMPPPARRFCCSSSSMQVLKYCV